MEIKKTTYRFICALIMTFLSSGSFFFVWFRFVRVNNRTGNLLGYGNLLMALGTYIFFFIVIGRWLSAFKVGVERIAKIIASVVLTVVFVDTVEIFVSMAITGQFRFFFQFLWRYALLALVQSFVLGLLMIAMVKLYRRIIPPLTMIAVNGEHNNNLVANLLGLRSKYAIRESVSADIPIDELRKKLKIYDAVLINDVPTNVEKNILKLCFDEDERVYILPKIADILLKSSTNLNVVDTPLYLCKNLRISGWEAVVKRVGDIVLSILALVILSPLFLIIAIAIKIDDRGPVFYRQERVTLNEKHFMILKFRSMIVDAEKDGKPHPAGEGDSRITKVGRFLRTFRLDELPQLINIIKGDMSIVGPRPERCEHVEKYRQEIPEFAYRHKVKGGLTGYAQIYGKYNTTALDKLKMDLMYITNYSLLLDLQILFETVKVIFMKDSTEGFDEKKIEEMHDAAGTGKEVSP